MRGLLRSLPILLTFAVAGPSVRAAENVLLICIDDLRPELGCYGAKHIRSPNIDALAGRGTLFERHYVQAPTCGASRYALLTGRFGPASNDALLQRAERLAAGQPVPVSLPGWFRQQGFETVAIGKVSHHPGGLAGDRWNDPGIVEMPDAWTRQPAFVGPWQDPEGWMHGLANGEIRVVQPGRRDVEMDVLQAVDGPDSIYPDGVMVDLAIQEIDTLGAAFASMGQRFLLAVGIVRPHLPFGAPKRYLDLYDGVTLPPIANPTKPPGRTTWHRSGEFMKYDRGGRDPNDDAAFADLVRRHYAACVSYADAQVGRLVARLDAAGLSDSTTIVVWGDHGWHLGEHAVWGKHTLFDRSLHAPLLIVPPGGRTSPERVETIVETVDVFPTLCDAVGLPHPPDLDGQSLTRPSGTTETAVGYFGRGQTIRNDRYRLIRHRSGFEELYDHADDPNETRNVADAKPEIASRLRRALAERLGR